MSPLMIDVMLWYRTRPGNYDHDNNWGAPAVREAISFFVEAGMLEATIPTEPGGAIHEITEGGRIYVKALCDLPLPVKKWVMP